MCVMILGPAPCGDVASPRTNVSVTTNSSRRAAGRWGITRSVTDSRVRSGRTTLMSDKQAGESGKSPAGGWLKTILGTVAGLLGGGIMMYLSPLLDKVIKPPRPVANFAVEHEG